MLEFEGLQKSFGSNRVLDGVGFAVAKQRTQRRIRAQSDRRGNVPPFQSRSCRGREPIDCHPEYRS